jgi:phospholipase A1/A2
MHHDHKKKKMKIRFLLALSFLAISSTNVLAQDIFDKNKISLRSQWDLGDSISLKKGLYKINQYKPLYFLLGNFTNNINQKPVSDNPNNSALNPIPLNNKELKFQVSFKTKVANKLFNTKYGGDLWVGYTQTSRWQLYNSELSRPFRETNYEPEIMYIVPTFYSFWGIQSVFAGIGINHQSNGRENPFSRSWNRIIAQIAWETKNTSIIIRPWWRVQEAPDMDDNPGIENFIGRGELLVTYGKGKHDLSVIGRHSLRFGDKNRGSIQIDYAIHLWDNLKFHTQVFHGYGESMIDFNHKQTTIGFGFSLIEWR